MKPGKRIAFFSLSLVASVLAVFFGKPAEACDLITLSTPSYDLTTNKQAVLDITVTRNNNGTTCNWAIAFDKGASNDGTYNRYLQKSPDKIPVQIFDEFGNQILKDLPDVAPPTSVVTGAFTIKGGSKTMTAKYKVVLGPIAANPSVGNYQNTFQAKLYQQPLTGGAYTLSSQAGFTATYSVVAAVDLSLVDTGQSFNMADTVQTLDFGNLAQNQQLSFDMLVSANRPFLYTMSSANNAKLQRTGGDASAQNNIAYQMTIGATPYTGPVVLTGFPYTSPGVSPAGAGVVTFPVTVKILDSTGAKFSGTYSDTVTITVQAQ